MEGRIFSIGYQERSLADFLELLAAHSVHVLVDVRETPWSRRSEYCKDALTFRLREIGIEYVHAKYAGNPRAIRRGAEGHADCLHAYAKYLSRNPSIVTELDEALGGRVRSGQNVCLLCYERHPDDCHRTILIGAWTAGRDWSPDVVHLAPDGARRLIEPDRTSNAR